MAPSADPTWHSTLNSTLVADGRPPCGQDCTLRASTVLEVCWITKYGFREPGVRFFQVKDLDLITHLNSLSQSHKSRTLWFDLPLLDTLQRGCLMLTTMLYQLYDGTVPKYPQGYPILNHIDLFRRLILTLTNWFRTEQHAPPSFLCKYWAELLLYCLLLYLVFLSPNHGVIGRFLQALQFPSQSTHSNPIFFYFHTSTFLMLEGNCYHSNRKTIQFRQNIDYWPMNKE